MTSGQQEIRTVMRKELKELVRDGRMRLLGAIVFILTIAALAFGAQQAVLAEHEREHAEERAHSQWEGQGDKNPHVAAHYGTHVFAPTSVVTAIDPGVTAYLGRAIKVEAHRSNLAAHASARDGSGLQRLGDFSVASVLLQLVPLLIIALGYGLWSRERESGTLRQLLATGVNPTTLFWGKALALTVVLAALLVPAGLIILGVLWSIGGGDSGTLSRLGLMGMSYAVYFAVFGALTLAASARFKSARGALVGMIAIWGLVVLVVPRVATEVAGAAVPLPSRAEFARSVTQGLTKGVDGATDRDVAVEAIAKDMMAKQGISGAGMLVDESFIRGIELQAEAEWENTVLAHVTAGLNDQLASQEQAVEWVGLLSPFVAMRTLSMGLAGTDLAHHRRFTEYTETWRQAFIKHLNDAFSKQAGAEGWDYKAGKELWQSAPPYKYETPPATFGLSAHLISAVSLGCWLVLSLLMAWFAARRLRVV